MSDKEIKIVERIESDLSKATAEVQRLSEAEGQAMIAVAEGIPDAQAKFEKAKEALVKAASNHATLERALAVAKKNYEQAIQAHAKLVEKEQWNRVKVLCKDRMALAQELSSELEALVKKIKKIGDLGNEIHALAPRKELSSYGPLDPALFERQIGYRLRKLGGFEWAPGECFGDHAVSTTFPNFLDLIREGHGWILKLQSADEAKI